MEDVRTALLTRLHQAGYQTTECGGGAVLVHVAPTDDDTARVVELVLPHTAVEALVAQRDPVVDDPDLPLPARDRVIGDVFGEILESLASESVTSMGVRRRRGRVEWFVLCR